MRGGAVAGVALLCLAVTTPVAEARPARAATQRVLTAVSAVAPDDVWAVGYTGTATLIRHWNGSKWSDVHSANPNGGDPVLTAVSARATDDVWAVGYVYQGPGPAPTLIEHWDGTTWTIVSSPGPAHQNGLYGVTSIAADNAWAVGYAGKQALILHWDGQSWSKVASPSTSGRTTLNAVTAISATNIWAVGQAGSKTLVEHSNGTTWKRVKSPTPSSNGDVLSGVAAATPRSIWAVGNNGDGTRTLILHWNGRRWRVQSSPSPSSSGNGLAAVAARSSTDAWAVGTSCCTSGGGSATLTMHWTGHGWHVVRAPNPSSSGDILAGVTAVHVGKVRAVGNTGMSNGGAAVLTLHWTGHRWAQP